MGLLRGLATLPVTGPLRGAGWLAAKIHEAAEAEYSDPAAIRRALGALEDALLKGEIDEDTFEAREIELIRRLGKTGR